MPVFGFAEEWFDPHLPLAHRLLVGRRRVIAADSLAVLFIEVPIELAAFGAVGALRAEGASLAVLGGCLIDAYLRDVVVPPKVEEGAPGASIDITFDVVGEILLAKEAIVLLVKP